MSRKCYKNKKKKEKKTHGAEKRREEKNYEQTSLCVYRVVVTF